MTISEGKNGTIISKKDNDINICGPKDGQNQCKDCKKLDALKPSDKVRSGYKIGYFEFGR